MGLLDRWNKDNNQNTMYQNLSTLYKQILNQVTSNELEILQFLEFSSQLYKYDLESVLFAYGQNPNAKFLADFNTWKSIGRSVTRGSKAIKVLHQKENGLFYHVNLFDVSQTTGKDFSFPVWLMDDLQFKKVTDWAFSSSEDAPDSLWNGIVEEYNKRRKEEVISISSVEEVSEFMLKYKLGQLPRWKDYIECVSPLVGDPELFIDIIPIIIKANYSLLTQIGKAKQELLLKERKNVENVRSNQSLSREDESSESGIQEKNKTHSELELSEERRRSFISSNINNERKSQVKSTRINDSRISSGEQSNIVSRTLSDGRANDLSKKQETRNERQREKNIHRTSSGKDQPITERSDSKNKRNQSIEGTSSRIDDERDSSNIEKSDKFSYQEIISVLKADSFTNDGKYRIYQSFENKLTKDELVDILKNEYGAGKKDNIGAFKLSVSFDSNGIKISDSDKQNTREMILSWNQAYDHIYTLVTAGMYLSNEEKLTYERFKHGQIAKNMKIEPKEFLSIILKRNELINLKRDINKFFSNEKDVIKQSEFLKERYGIGALSSPKDPYYYAYSEKGITLSNYYDSETFKWDEVAMVIQNLINKNEYMDEKDYVEQRNDQFGLSKKEKTHTENSEINKEEIIDLTDWTELPEEYRYQRLNNKVYLVNSNGEFETNPVELIYSEGKAYYKLMPEKTVVKENEFKAAEEVDLFDFQYTDQKQEMVVPVVVNEDIEKIDFSFDTKDNSFYGKKPKERMKDNLVALSLLKQLEKEQRLATIEEQKILAKYVGWGGLSEIFNPDNHSYAKEREELKHLITNEEYESARESVLTAYYTDPMIIEQIYDTVQRLGFKHGRILDPAMGTGNFFAAMPKEMKEKSQLYGVELDPLSASISKQLQQSVHIEEKGFEDTQFIDGSFDLVVANVPFADFRIMDKKTLDSYYIHDYFIKHSLDLVHEGGIVAVITSSGTLDKKDSYFRKELSNQAELLGAVRLPETAFKEIAGTEVTTDILFFRKEAAELKREYEERSWESTVEIPSSQRLEDGSLQPPVTINRFYAERREAILGTFKFKNFRGGTYTVAPIPGTDLKQQLKEQLQFIHGEYIQPSQLEYNVPDVLPIADNSENEMSESNIPPYTYFEKDGDIYYQVNGISEKQNLGETRKKRMMGMIKIRDILSEVISYQQIQNFDQEVFSQKLSKLNEVYDEFVSKYGSINQPVNSRLFYDDDRYALLSSIEIPQKDGTFIKGDVFKKATIRQIEPVKRVDSALAALNHSLSKYGKVDIEYMNSIYPVEQTELLTQLDEHIFIDVEKFLQEDKNSNAAYVTKDAYLSGDVKHKLSLARMMAESDKSFEKNVIALEKVIPRDLTISEIEYDVGTSWIPIDTYHTFMKDIFETSSFNLNHGAIKVEYNRFTDTYYIKGKTYDNSVLVRNEYGTKRINGYQILEKSLNMKTVQIFDKEEVWVNGEKVIKDVLNVKETMLARAKQEHIHHVFKDWLFKDPDRAKKLLKIYNDKFNRIRPRQYDGSFLSFEGMNEQFELRPHQKNVVARIVENGRALMAHEVGAGKTASMISAGMMMKDQGLIQKPMYVVPNHLTEQFGQELLRFYPSKKVLITGKKDFEKKNRHKFISRIATGDYDAVVIGHSQFEKISLSKERRIALIKKDLKEIEEGIQLEKSESGESWSLKQMVSFEKRLKEKLKSLQNEDYKDRLLTFEELGVDFLFVDEAHSHKNLYTYTKMSNVAGVNTSNSLRATDMYMKCQYMLEKFQGRGVVFATGTPISNSMSELYTMQRYLQPEELARMDLYTFDRWASTFGEVVTAPEINPEGSGFRMKSRFAKFHNLPELMSSFHLVADIQTSDMLKLPVPDIANGKPQLIVSEPSEFQEQKMMELAERADNIRLGNVDPREDNMLKLTNEAKLMAIDTRLLDPEAPVYKEGKLYKCSEKVFEIWQDTLEKHSTQIIFSDSGTPNPNKFNVYDEMKRILIEKGIPEVEIAFIHSAKNDRQREELFDKVRHGEVRVILGSTEKLGTGTNIQDKLIALHHLDVPWRPSDLTQRDGRGIRQGNENLEVQIYRYVAKNSFDSYLWQTQENKLKFINQVMTGKSIARSADDIDQSTLDAAEAKALATNNPMLVEKMTIDREVMNLQLQKSDWQSNRLTLTQNLESVYPKELEEIQMNLEKTIQDNEWVASIINSDFSIKLLGNQYTDRSEALEVFNTILQTEIEQGKEIGEFYGFSIKLEVSRFGQMVVSLERERSYAVAIEKNGKGTFTRMANVLKTLPDKINDLKNEKDNLIKKMNQAEQQVLKPFEKEEVLNELLERQTALNLSLEMREKTSSNSQQAVVEISEPLVTTFKNSGLEQSR